jgi:hypothetical protein
MAKTFTCEHCGGVFEFAWSDEAAHAEAVRDFGVRGDAPAKDTPGGEGMARICDDCYRAFMQWLATRN